MDLEKILEMWKKDSTFDECELDKASLNIPQLHQKYLTIRSEYVLLLDKKRSDLKKAEHLKWLYYSGKALPEEYEDKPFPYKLLKNEVHNWVENDELIQSIELKVKYYCATIDAIDEILKQVNQLSFNIKNAIEWRRFVGGV